MMVHIPGNYTTRHVTEINEKDYVWDSELGHWRRVTSAFTYVDSKTGNTIVKLVLDITSYDRYNAHDDITFVVLLDDEPSEKFKPMTARDRRRKMKQDDANESAVDTTKTAPVPSEASDGPVSEQSEMPSSGSVETSHSPVDMSGQNLDIRARREALKISRGAFAKMCGLSPGALWRVEDGRPKGDELQKVINTLVSKESK